MHRAGKGNVVGEYLRDAKPVPFLLCDETALSLCTWSLAMYERMLAYFFLTIHYFRPSWPKDPPKSCADPSAFPRK